MVKNRVPEHIVQHDPRQRYRKRPEGCARALTPERRESGQVVVYNAYPEVLTLALLRWDSSMSHFALASAAASASSREK